MSKAAVAVLYRRKEGGFGLHQEWLDPKHPQDLTKAIDNIRVRIKKLGHSWIEAHLLREDVKEQDTCVSS